MRKHHLAVVVAAAVVAVTTAFWASSVREPDGGGLTGARLLPGLDGIVNDVTEIAVVGAGDQIRVTLNKGDTRWSVSQAGGYPADSGKIRKLLVGLADAHIVEAKTANPDNYHHLGVEDVDGAEAGGLLLTLAGPGEPVSLVVGKRPDRDGTYVRLAGEMQSYLIDQSVQLDDNPDGWLDRRLLDIPSASIQRITVRHPDGEVVTAAKTARGEDNFALADVPAGRSVSSPGAANAMATVLKGLNFDGVESAQGFDAGEIEPVITEFLTFDGVKITSRALEKDGQYYVQFQAAFDEGQAQAFAPGAVAFGEQDPAADAPPEGEADAAAGSEPSAVADTAVAVAEVAPPDFTGPMEQAAALQARLATWVFRIPSYKYQQMTRRMDAMLAPAAE